MNQIENNTTQTFGEFFASIGKTIFTNQYFYLTLLLFVLLFIVNQFFFFYGERLATEWEAPLKTEFLKVKRHYTPRPVRLLHLILKKDLQERHGELSDETRQLDGLFRDLNKLKKANKDTSEITNKIVALAASKDSKKQILKLLKEYIKFSYASETWISRKTILAATHSSLVPDPTKPSTEIQRLIDLYQTSNNLSRYHFNIARDLSIYSFTFVTVATVSGIISVICLLFIGKGGWQNANPYILNVFVVTTATSLLYATLINIYKYDDNVNLHKGLSKQYMFIAHGIRNSLATGILKRGTKKTDLPAYITYETKKIRRIYNFAIGLDSSQIPKFDPTKAPF